TLNEPWVVAHVGYRDGRHAPGIRDAAQAVAANHHLLLAHGRAVAALRASSTASDIGITLNLTVERPVTPEAAGHAAELEARQNGVYLDPIFRGRYPELLDGNAAYSPAAAGGLVRDGDFGVIGAPLDFLGVNFYSPHYVGLLRPDGEPRRGETVSGPGTVSIQPEGLPITAMNWLVEPNSIRELLTRVVVPVTGELHDYLTQDGRVHDLERISYLRGHLAALHAAIGDGVPLKGYFAWSLLDNFE